MTAGTRTERECIMIKTLANRARGSRRIIDSIVRNRQPQQERFVFLNRAV